jgi:ADP-ribose pyrophosphatase YjhB (NUDIX family)
MFQSYWRLSRSLSLDVRACVRDAQGRVALVRLSDSAMWQFPGGIVEQGETAAGALSRLLFQDAGLEGAGDATLFAVYAGTEAARFDQRALFLVPSWRRLDAGMVNAPADIAFFEAGRLPHDTDPAVPVRLAEISRARALSEVW